MHLESYNCVLCLQNVEETCQHLFLLCPFAQQCWNFIQVVVPFNEDFQEVIEYFKDALRISSLCQQSSSFSGSFRQREMTWFLKEFNRICRKLEIFSTRSYSCSRIEWRQGLPLNWNNGYRPWCSSKALSLIFFRFFLCFLIPICKATVFFLYCFLFNKIHCRGCKPSSFPQKKVTAWGLMRAWPSPPEGTGRGQARPSKQHRGPMRAWPIHFLIGMN